MMKWITYGLVFIVGVGVGWQAHLVLMRTEPAPGSFTSTISSSATQARQQPLQPVSPAVEQNTPGRTGSNPSHPVNDDGRRDDAKARAETTHADHIRRFSLLLKQHEFSKAIEYYEQIESNDEKAARILKDVLLEQIQRWQNQGQLALALEACTAFLGAYYNDIQILKAQARTQELSGDLIAALDSYYQARIYSTDETTMRAIDTLINTMVKERDTLLANSRQWPELIELYLHLVELEPDAKQYLLRLAEVYHLAQDNTSAELTLSDLLDDPQWQDRAQSLMEEINPDLKGRRSVKLVKHGSHYVIAVRIDGMVDLSLVIDTGATLTILTQEAFNKLSSQTHLDYLGQKSLSTANGMVEAPLYSAETLSLGPYSVNDVALGVIDFADDSHIDGLLGMNALRHYDFEIDQEKALLYLTPHK